MTRVACVLLHNLSCYGRLVIEMRIALMRILTSNTDALCGMGETPWKPKESEPRR